MKRAIIFTMGTRGDVQPYIYLAQALRQHGYDVAIGTHPCWADLVSGAHVPFVPIGPDIDIAYEAAVIRGKTKSPVMSMLKTMRFVFKIIERASDDIYQACQGMDFVIVSHSQMGATEADMLHIPTINVTLQTEMIPKAPAFQTRRDRLMGALINPQMVKPYNKIRKRYHLPPVRSMNQIMSQKLDLIPISRYVTEQNSAWEPQHTVVGYWYRQDEDFQPDTALRAFLQAGERPIILALGAMSFESEQERDKLDIFVRAFQKTGMRALIQGFNRTLADYPLPDTMLAIGSVPHSWLFKQGYCVIHHCGFGTAASAMLYGIPSIPVPHVLDQFQFAARIHALQAGVAPIKASALTEETLVQAIETMQRGYADMQRRVAELSRKMQAEDGLGTSVALIGEALAASM
nr:glycosyltransferase [Maliibacterium massiliense]